MNKFVRKIIYIGMYVIPAFAVNVDGTVCTHGYGLGCMREKHGWDCRRQKSGDLCI